VIDLGAAELVGYAASALVVLSLTMRSVVRFRFVSLLGSITFMVYAALIESPPLIVTNLAIAAINIWFLHKELGLRRDLGASLIAVDSPFLQDFIDFHMADIRSFQPDASMPPSSAFCVLLTRDGLPAGAIIGSRHGDELDITLDYVMRAYRDSRLGRWVFGEGAKVFRDAGITRLTSDAGGAMHQAYLAGAGFVRHGDRYQLDLTHR
jgi:hypothetical protein